jgi:hypothetical protein
MILSAYTWPLRFSIGLAGRLKQFGPRWQEAAHVGAEQRRPCRLGIIGLVSDLTEI